MLFQIENQYSYGLKILSRTVSFWYSIKWAQKLSLLQLDSPVLKIISIVNALCTPFKAMIGNDHNLEKDIS